MSALGFNTGYIEELYRQYLDDPQSVSASWRDFFDDYQPGESFVAAAEARPGGGDEGGREQRVAPATGDGESAQAPEPETQPPAPSGDGAREDQGAPVLRSASAPSANGASIEPMRGAAGKIAENMEKSIGVPTATSVRSIPVRLLSENRVLVNDYQRQVGGEKVSYTHVIAYALVQAMREFPAMNATFRHDEESGEPQKIVPEHVNLGVAISVERRGKKSLLVPNVKAAEDMSFAQFLGIFNDLVKRTQGGDLEMSDFDGTTASITNPGMIGTRQSVPRLMPGQGVIVGVGAIGYPPEYRAFAPERISRMGVSQVMNVTSTYDHRVIQGAVSGAFLAHIEALLLGEHGFYSGLFADLSVPYQPFSAATDSTPGLGNASGQNGSLDGGTDEQAMTRKQAAVLQLIRSYRVRGHLQADVNPLGYDWTDHPELDPANYDLTIWDLDREFITGGLGGEDKLPLREILSILRDTYTRKVGFETMHISSPSEKRWLQERIEPTRASEDLSEEERRRIMKRLNSAEAFERFLHTKYIGHKRFSLEGSESMIPIIDTLISDAADQESREVVMGMAHRGRLNVLANIIGKPYEQIFSEFEGNIDPATIQGSGDVKYHLGADGTYESPGGNEIAVTLASNPSHLEAVNPVVEGYARAQQELLRSESEQEGRDYLDAVLPLLIHGDAAFAGQGVAAETLNLSQLRGYKTGGTIHLVVNNQIGFTTLPSDARSSRYATDIARAIQAPIFHVNGDDPEACVRVARLALDYRQVFNKDVVIDMMCYRVHGHNEGDEPTYTQPLLYEKIEAKRSPRKIYTESLLRRGVVEPDEAEQMLGDYRAQLQDAFERTEDLEEKDAEEAYGRLQERRRDHPDRLGQPDTTADEDDLHAVVRALTDQPEGFHVHKKLKRQFDRRDDLFEDGKIDWAFAEILAFGSLILEGTNVRLAGQDTRRATFSQRHSVLIDQETGEEYIPLNHMRTGEDADQAQLLAYDSLLSEYAACGFEYGYSVGDPSALVCWEAQFGDFANGAQIVFDQFMSAAEEKWGQTSALTLLLPHAYEGQGPEHSSARLERFLQMCAENNMVVANFSTPANYFHALRRQVKRDRKKPMVVMTPKSLLRNPKCISAPEGLTGGGVQEVIPSENDEATRLLFCSGKVYYDLKKALDEDDESHGEVAIARLEQFYPFPEDEVKAELERHSDVDEVVWVQEEPQNMGAWTFVRPRFEALLDEIHGRCEQPLAYAGRPAMASPATGSAKVHKREQQALIGDALGLESAAEIEEDAGGAAAG